LPFSQQAIWWLNGFWDEEKDKEAETIFGFVQKFKELDHGDKVVAYKGKAKDKFSEYKEGNQLDEFKSHKFLESLGQTLTAIELRKRLETIDIDKNHKMALAEYLLFRYNKTPEVLVAAPQGEK